MMISRLMRPIVAAMLPLAVAAVSASAQGITTGAISGTVLSESGNPIPDVVVSISNPSTGARATVNTRANGQYFVQGLEVGGPYTVSARRIGMAQQTHNDVIVRLSQTTRVDFTMKTTAVQLGGVVVEATRTEVFAPSNTGPKSVVSDTAIQRLPTSSRNLTDFIKLTPQASATGAGFSGGGASNRMNNVQIDGASERDVFGLGATGTPGAEVNSKGISIDAVKEYQVLLAPFDVRQGNFGGLLLNAVTKSGTNDVHGSAYYFFRNERFGADTNVLRGTQFDRTQWGFTVGGPIIRDKLHYFIAPEFTTENTPVTGPYLGQPANSSPAFPFTQAQVDSLQNILTGLGASPGTPGYSNIPNPLNNFFGRVDWQINDVHRLVARFNYADGERLRQQNGRNATTAVFTSNFHNFRNVKMAPVVQLFSAFKGGSFNELFVGYNNWYNRRTPLDNFPQIRINTVVGTAVTPSVTGAFLAGADQFSQGNELDTKTWELTDNYTRPFGPHTFTVGTRQEKVWLRNLFTQSSYGVWGFRNLDSLAAGNANSFRKAIILANGGNVEFSALQSAFYGEDQWQVNPNLAVTLGLRADVSSFLKDIEHNLAIDTAYGRNTSDIPKRSVQFSPRFGFNWDVTGTLTDQVRGGVGLFVGTPPYVWLENAYINSGNIQTFLNCNTAGSGAPAPAFNVDPSTISVCRNGQGTAPIGDVNFLSSNLKFPQPLRASLAYDRRLPWDLVATLEGLYSKTLNNFFFYNLNLQAPQGTGQGGRVLYSQAVTLAGATVPLPPAAVAANGGTARFSTAIDLKNQSKDYAYNITAQLRKRYSNNWEGMVAYTYSQARDVQSFGSSTHISNWQFGRTLSGRQEDPFTGISLFDQPHKLMANGTLTLPWAKFSTFTDISAFYQGVSGSPHDYIYGGSGTVGDLNGDAFQGNDLFYVPKDARNPAEIVFQTFGTRTAAQQANDMEDFISKSPCLDSQRGTIMKRNSCRLPFSNTMDVALRQRFPSIRGQEFAITLDIFDFGNLLNKNWGKLYTMPFSSNSNIPLVTHVGYTTTNPQTAIPIVRFTPPANGYAYSVPAIATNFWRTQLSVRYSF
ncbi:MAG TPA: carboxypeptidase regulatory-like domain-containing protein [Gemmatimonadaceae bacterium]|nr:carboxypeptidase regulatory-like domain-containing protein [Gemmatimonadaceae bacterium]